MCVVRNNCLTDAGCDSLFVELGDSISLIPSFFSTLDIKGFEWTSVNNPDVSCKDCPITGVVPLRNGSFIITMIDVDGCEVMDTVVVRVSRNKDVFAPNVISANSDGINDVFFIQGKANAYVVERLQIYDRWGNLVFEDVNFIPGDASKGWDGTHKGKQVVSGVYVWKASLRFIDGNLDYVTGNITVIH